MSIKSKLKGTTADSFFLIFVRLVSTLVTLIMTRIVAGHFSILDYGTYSQVSLLVSTITSITILGMTDGVNYFFCRENDIKKRNEYVSSIFSLQLFVSCIAAIMLFCLAKPISKAFNNEQIENLIFFPLFMPCMGNFLTMLQTLFFAIGKAKTIAVRNLILCAAKLGARIVACYVFNNIFAILVFAMIFEVIQLVYFIIVLKNNGLNISLFNFNKTLAKEIIFYCLPMGMFVLVNSLNRYLDKYVITAFTDVETLAIYTNSAKALPFDIITYGFITILIPYLTRAIANKDFENAKKIYKTFLEVSYVITGILTMAAICVAPEFMQFLYTEKYLSGVGIFSIYIVVDLLKIMGMTLVLSSSGKTKSIMYSSLCCLGANLILNIILFKLIGWYGPAVSTVIVTSLNGFAILYLSAKAIKCKLRDIFDFKFLALFILETVATLALVTVIKHFISKYISHYFLIMVVCAAAFGIIMLLLNIKRLLSDFSIIDKNTKKESKT